VAGGALQAQTTQENPGGVETCERQWREITQKIEAERQSCNGRPGGERIKKGAGTQLRQQAGMAGGRENPTQAETRTNEQRQHAGRQASADGGGEFKRQKTVTSRNVFQQQIQCRNGRNLGAGGAERRGRGRQHGRCRNDSINKIQARRQAEIHRKIQNGRKTRIQEAGRQVLIIQAEVTQKRQERRRNPGGRQKRR